MLSALLSQFQMFYTAFYLYGAVWAIELEELSLLDWMARLFLLDLQAHFSQLNDRDEAMSRSLNSDYLDQLLIKGDTSRLDEDLVRLAVEERPVPKEEQALLIFKRG